MSTETEHLLTDQGAADLAPLRNSHEADQLETELKALFMQMFEQYVRPGLDAVATVGAPHLGGLDQLERAVKMDGIALQRAADEGAMRYLHKAFRARNPKRGLHMLRAYLQALFGTGGWELVQQWQDSEFSYPTMLYENDGPGRFLTTRIQARVIPTGLAKTPELMAQAFRSVLPARMLLRVALMANPYQSSVGMFLGAAATVLRQQFAGDFVDPPFRLLSEMGGVAHAGATAALQRQKFTGTFT